ncbi:MAG: peptidoglycan-associated lipoprotein Pal [Caulobacteraceae bacterium]
MIIAMAALSLAACASRPKPLGPAATNSTPPAPEAPYAPPPTPGAVTESPGAPIPGSVRDFVINAGDRVYFDYDSDALRPDASPVLEAQSSWLNRYPDVRVRVEGNCDERGTEAFNFALGARRAEAVKNFLVEHGVSPGRIQTVSYGKERPIDPGHDEAAWAKNRNAVTDITGGARGE